MEALRELFVALGLDWDKSGFAAAHVAAEALEGAAEKLAEGFMAVAESVVEAVTGTAEYGSRLSDASKQTGVAAEELQKLEYAAATAGVGHEELAMSVVNLSKNMQAAAEGSEGQQEAFAAMGVSIFNAQGKMKTADAVIKEMANSFQRLGPGVKSTQLASELLGRSGSRLLPVLLEGKEGLDEMGAKAEELGLIMSQQTADGLSKLTTQWGLLGGALDSVKRDFALPLLEAFKQLIDNAIEWISKNRELIRDKAIKAGKELATVLIGIVDALKKGVTLLVELSNLTRFFAIAALAAAAAVVVWNAALAIQAMGLTFLISYYASVAAAAITAAVTAAAAWWMATWPLLALIAGFILLGLAIDDIIGFFNGDDSLIGDWGVAWTKFLDEWLDDSNEDGWVMGALKWVLYAFTHIGDIIPTTTQEWKDTFTDFFKWLARGFLAVGDFIGDTLIGGVIKTGVRGFLAGGDFIANAFGGGASPEASVASSSAGGTNSSQSSSSLSQSIVINQSPGQSAAEVANAVVEQTQSFHDARMREAADAAE